MFPRYRLNVRAIRFVDHRLSNILFLDSIRRNSMSLCHHTYRRCASFALVLALVLIALPALLNAQTAPNDTVPKAEWFIGYQWLNPGGYIPDQNVPPNAVKLPSITPGAGTSLAYNFTRNLAFEGDYGL